jgi:hypothetical protein
MKIRSIMALSAVVLASSASSASAQMAHDVTFGVQAIHDMTVSTAPINLVISSATAGAPTSATATATYSITTNDSLAKITAAIDSDMPNGVTLTANLAVGATGATSAGAVVLGTSATDVVTGITKATANDLSISYVLSATLAAGVVPTGTRTVTYTFAAGS